MSLTSFLHRIRSTRSFHDSLSAVASSHANPSQMATLQSQTAVTHAHIRDRLYLTSFLCTFNVVFPILDREWEETYLTVLRDETGQFEPPLYWSFQYTSAIAIGALMHDDPLYANESASVARHAASALFDEAHSQVLRGLLLLSFLLIGLGQSSRASCYIAVANRMVFLLSRPPCIDPHIANSSHVATSTLAFPGTFPDARVPLTLPPVPASNSSHVGRDLKLMYSLVEDMSSAASTLYGMVHIGWDRVERCIVENKKRAHIAKQTAAAAAAAAAASTTTMQTESESTLPSATLPNTTTTAAASTTPSSSSPSTELQPTPSPSVSHAYHSLSSDHLLTMGLECRHYSPNVFDESQSRLDSWRAQVQASSSATTTADLTVGHELLLGLFAFLTSFRGDFMQLVRPTHITTATTGTTTTAAAETDSSSTTTATTTSTAMSLEAFEASLANTRAALRLCDSLCDLLAHIATTSPTTTSSGDVKAESSTVSTKSEPGLPATTPRARSISSVSSPDSITRPLSSLSSSDLRTILTQVSPSVTGATPLPALQKQTPRAQLHALALLFKAIFMHMIVLEQETSPSHGVSKVESAPAASAGSSPRLSWSQVILASNTATSFLDVHHLDLTYCAFFGLLLHLHVQIKLKYVKQCMASWKRSQNAQMLQMAHQTPTNTSTTTPTTRGDRSAASDGSTKTTPAVVPLPTATQTLMDSLHYLHLDFTHLDALNHHWSSTTATIWKDAQERVAELLCYLRAPVGVMTSNTPAEVARTADDKALLSSIGAVTPSTTSPLLPPGVESLMLEDALRVFRSISQRYPLFTVGHSMAKLQSTMVSASYLQNTTSTAPAAATSAATTPSPASHADKSMVATISSTHSPLSLPRGGSAHQVTAADISPATPTPILQTSTSQQSQSSQPQPQHHQLHQPPPHHHQQPQQQQQQQHSTHTSPMSVYGSLPNAPSGSYPMMPMPVSGLVSPQSAHPSYIYPANHLHHHAHAQQMPPMHHHQPQPQVPHPQHHHHHQAQHHPQQHLHHQHQPHQYFPFHHQPHPQSMPQHPSQAHHQPHQHPAYPPPMHVPHQQSHAHGGMTNLPVSPSAASVSYPQSMAPLPRPSESLVGVKRKHGGEEEKDDESSTPHSQSSHLHTYAHAASPYGTMGPPPPQPPQPFVISPPQHHAARVATTATYPTTNEYYHPSSSAMYSHGPSGIGVGASPFQPLRSVSTHPHAAHAAAAAHAAHLTQQAPSRSLLSPSYMPLPVGAATVAMPTRTISPSEYAANAKKAKTQML